MTDVLSAQALHVCDRGSSFVQAGEPGQACHGCGAPLSAYVLRRVDGGSKLVRVYRKFASPGTFGAVEEISAIEIGGDDGMAIESGGCFRVTVLQAWTSSLPCGRTCQAYTTVQNDLRHQRCAGRGAVFEPTRARRCLDLTFAAASGPDPQDENSRQRRLHQIHLRRRRGWSRSSTLSSWTCRTGSCPATRRRRCGRCDSQPVAQRSLDGPQRSGCRPHARRTPLTAADLRTVATNAGGKTLPMTDEQGMSLVVCAVGSRRKSRQLPAAAEA